MTIILRVEDRENLLGSVAMSLIVIIIVKYIGEEGLSLHHLKAVTPVNVVLVKDDSDVRDAIPHAFLSAILQTSHVLVEDVSGEQVCEEVESHQHEEHEEERVEEVDVHGWQEDVREVCSREQNRHVPVCVLDRRKILEAFERRSVEVVNCECENEDVREDGYQDIKRVD